MSDKFMILFFFQELYSVHIINFLCTKLNERYLLLIIIIFLVTILSLYLKYHYFVIFFLFINTNVQ